MAMENSPNDHGAFAEWLWIIRRHLAAPALAAIIASSPVPVPISSTFTPAAVPAAVPAVVAAMASARRFIAPRSAISYGRLRSASAIIGK